MIAAHCRHRTYPAFGGDWPTRCKEGIAYATIPRAPWCCERIAAGSAPPCPFFEQWTDEEIAANRALPPPVDGP